ncbi:hypothetical protein RB195_024776 [Necator americanus]|uniref:Uncharacterized protein n=1 Tax=Necator americanus TaxID=51031 RepID=A0ABR1EPJ4_NECAM
MAKNIDSFEQFTTRIGRLRMRRCDPTPALTIFVAYAPTSSYEEEVESFSMEPEKFYREDHTLYKPSPPAYSPSEGRCTCPKGSSLRHAIMSAGNRTTPDLDGIRPEHLKNLLPVLIINTLRQPNLTPQQAERVLAEFDETCEWIVLQLYLKKAMSMRNEWVSNAPFTLNGTSISERTSYVYSGRELNIKNDLTPMLGRKKRAA